MGLEAKRFLRRKSLGRLTLVFINPTDRAALTEKLWAGVRLGPQEVRPAEWRCVPLLQKNQVTQANFSMIAASRMLELSPQ